MSKKKNKKSKKYKKPNVVDSRIPQSKTIKLKTDLKEEERRKLFEQTKNLPGFFIFYKITGAIKKTVDLACIADITAIRYRFTNYGNTGRTNIRVIELGKVSHGWVNSQLINNLRTNNTDPTLGASVVSMGKYTRRNNTTSLRFTAPSPLAHAELIGMSYYYTVSHQSQVQGPHATCSLYHETIDRMEEVLNTYPHIHQGVIDIYFQDSQFINHLNKCVEMAQDSIHVKNNNLIKDLIGDKNIFEIYQ